MLERIHEIVGKYNNHADTLSPSQYLQEGPSLVIATGIDIVIDGIQRLPFSKEIKQAMRDTEVRRILDKQETLAKNNPNEINNLQQLGLSFIDTNKELLLKEPYNRISIERAIHAFKEEHQGLKCKDLELAYFAMQASRRYLHGTYSRASNNLDISLLDKAYQKLDKYFFEV